MLKQKLRSNAYYRFMSDLEYELYELKKKKDYSNIIFLCVGTDRLAGDSFGPLVGQKIKDYLEKQNICNIDVFGDLQKVVGFNDVLPILESIEKKYKNPCVITIDAALSKKEYIGEIIVTDKGVEIGKGLSKRSKMIGDIGIKAVVGRNMNLLSDRLMMIQNIPIERVMNLSDIVSDGILQVIQYI